MSSEHSVFVKPGVEGLLSPLMSWLNNPKVSEIMMNKPYEVFVEEEGVMRCHRVPEFTPIYVHRLFQMIANESKQRLDEAHPLLSATLYNGYRVQLIIPPVSQHHTLAIRKASITSLTLEGYAKQGFYQHMQPVALHQTPHSTQSEAKLTALYQQQRWGEFIKLAVLLRKNIVISGGTSSGKTTFLKACIEAIPLHERLIILEDTRELFFSHANQVSLLALKGAQGIASIDMQMLLQASLRLRPDRLIMGEIRGKEIMDFVMACSTGHEGSLTSIHANSPQIALQRMIQLYKQNNVPSMRDEEIRAELTQVIDIIIQLAKCNKERRAVSCYYKAAT